MYISASLTSGQGVESRKCHLLRHEVWTRQSRLCLPSVSATANSYPPSHHEHHSPNNCGQIVVPFRLGMWWTPAGIMLSELIEPVEGSYFVGFSERRIVEDHVAEVFRRPSIIEEYGLSNMNDFGRALPQGVHAKELVRLRIKEEFEHASFIAEHHALCELGVLCDSHFVRNSIRCQCFLGL